MRLALRSGVINTKKGRNIDDIRSVNIAGQSKNVWSFPTCFIPNGHRRRDSSSYEILYGAFYSTPSVHSISYLQYTYLRVTVGNRDTLVSLATTCRPVIVGTSTLSKRSHGVPALRLRGVGYRGREGGWGKRGYPGYSGLVEGFYRLDRLYRGWISRVVGLERGLNFRLGGGRR